MSFLLQETLLQDVVGFSGYCAFELPHTSTARVCITLVKHSIHCSFVANLASCGAGLEVLAVKNHCVHEIFII